MVPKKTQERINKQFGYIKNVAGMYPSTIINEISEVDLAEKYEKIVMPNYNSISFTATLNLIKCLLDENFIKKIFINNKVLTVLFSNGEHICAKCSDEDEYSVFVGFCVAMTKYIFQMNAKHIREMILDKVDPKKKEEVAENLKQGTNTVRNLINLEAIKYKYQNITFDCANGKIIIEGKEPREPDPELLKTFDTWSAINKHKLDQSLFNERNENNAINKLDQSLFDERNENEEE